MPDIEHFAAALQSLAGIDRENFELSAAYWRPKSYHKGEYYNEYQTVCKYLGFIDTGIFRGYYLDEKGSEKNVFFFSENQLVVAFKSFVTQTPCSYYTQAMTDASVRYIHVEQLHELYRKSHQWEHFGRLIAEMAFNIAMTRAESFMFMSPEERYLDLIRQHPNIFNAIPLYHISSYLGIQGPSLSRIRKRLVGR